MSKSRQSFQKKEKEKKRLKDKQEKKEKLLQRRSQKKDNASLDDMMAYLDENGNIVSEPPKNIES